MQNQKSNAYAAIAVALCSCFLGGCGILAPMTDSPSVDSVRSDQSIIQPDAYHDMIGGDDPHFDSDSFLGGFGGSLGR